jgi:hypothetical protein
MSSSDTTFPKAGGKGEAVIATDLRINLDAPVLPSAPRKRPVAPPVPPPTASAEQPPPARHADTAKRGTGKERPLPAPQPAKQQRVVKQTTPPPAKPDRVAVPVETNIPDPPAVQVVKPAKRNINIASLNADVRKYGVSNGITTSGWIAFGLSILLAVITIVGFIVIVYRLLH